MLKPKEFIYFYRVLNWEEKINCLRPLGYVLLGYAVAGKFDFGLNLANTLALIGIFIFVYSLNDFYDWKLRGERNFLGLMIEKKEISEKQAIVYSVTPLGLIFPLIFFKISLISWVLLFLGTGLAVIYSLPLLRLKEKRPFRLITFPFCMTLLFCQGFSLMDIFKTSTLMLGVIVFLYHCFIEALHIVSDWQEGEKQVITQKEALKLLGYLPCSLLVISLIFALVNPLFLTTSLFSLARMRVVAQKNIIGEVLTIRKNIFDPFYLPWEFGFYALFGILRWL